MGVSRAEWGGKNKIKSIESADDNFSLKISGWRLAYKVQVLKKIGGPGKMTQ